MAEKRIEQGRWALSAMYYANGLVLGAWAGQIPLLLVRHDITIAELGYLLLVLGTGAIAAMLLAGRVIDNHGAKRVLAVFSLFSVAVLPIVVMAPSVLMLALAMAAMGAVIGCMDLAMNTNAIEVERVLGRSIMASSHGFWSLGCCCGAGLGGLAAAEFGGVVQAFGTAAVCLVLVENARVYLVGSTAGTARAVGQIRPVLLPRDSGLWLIGILALGAMIPQGAIMNWAAIFTGLDHGAGIGFSVQGFALFSLGMALVRFGGEYGHHRYGPVSTLRTSGLIGAVGLMIAALSPNAGLAIAGFAVAGIGVANLVPVLYSAAGNLPGHSTGTGIAAVSMMGYAGFLMLPTGIGLVTDAAGFRLAFGALALLMVLVAAKAGREAQEDGTLDGVRV